MLPDLVHYLLWRPDVLDIAFSFRHLANPFRALANLSLVQARGWELVPALIALNGVIAWVWLVYLGTRATDMAAAMDRRQPPRVTEETGRGDLLY